MSVSEKVIVMSQPTMLFDGDCGICSWASDKAQEIDREGRWSVVPYQVWTDAALAPWGLDQHACGQYLRVLMPSGQVYSGIWGIMRFLADHRSTAIFAVPIYLLPPLTLLAGITYELVARNRRSVSLALGMNACKLG
jgi:predicted DCC family thiol-disulfide oxidoreductase YuxK